MGDPTRAPRRRRPARALAAALVVLAACATEPPPPKPVPEGEPARRAAAAFVHCIEGGSPTCVRTETNYGGWDAFYLLGWLSSGSPTAILRSLQRELLEHGEARLVQARFVGEVARYDMAIRGAECDPLEEGSLQPLAPLVDQVAAAAQERLTGFGLWRGDMESVVAGLAAEARDGLAGGYLVRLRCTSDPYALYLATTRDGERQVVVGMTTRLPRFLGGEAADRASMGKRLNSRSLGYATPPTPREGAVHPWLDFPVEEF